jgi:hypothetical protein
MRCPSITFAYREQSDFKSESTTSQIASQSDSDCMPVHTQLVSVLAGTNQHRHKAAWFGPSHRCLTVPGTVERFMVERFILSGAQPSGVGLLAVYILQQHAVLIIPGQHI